MIIINELKDIRDIGPLCVALGSFDGLHKGHQKLIRRCVEISHKNGYIPAVFSFFNHPLDAIKGPGTVKPVISEVRKAQLLSEMSIEYLVAPEFTKDIMVLNPEDFIKSIILDNMDMRHAVCGFNYSFGYRASGKAKDLRTLGRKYCFGTTVCRELKIDGVTASSTELRHIIEIGDDSSYFRFTGRRFSLDHINTK